MQPLPPELERRAFSVREAAAAGVPVSHLRRRTLATPFRGVRTPADADDDLLAMCRAYAARMPDGHYFSHLTAARLRGLWLPMSYRRGEPLHVTAIDTGRAPRIPGVVGHHIDEDRSEWSLLSGLRVASSLEAARTLAPTLGVEDLAVVLDSLRRRSGRLVSEEQLLFMLAKHGGQRGIRRLRAAYSVSRSGADSAMETRLRRGLVLRGLPEPLVNPVISRPGRRERFGDLVWPRWSVVVEYEGTHHQADRDTYVDDISRYEELADDWSFVRVTREHVRDFPRIISRIQLARRQ